jgi:hypothetical protein
VQVAQSEATLPPVVKRKVPAEQFMISKREEEKKGEEEKSTKLADQASCG